MQSAKTLARQLGNWGYTDGYSGRPMRRNEPEYRRSYHHGTQARQRDHAMKAER